MTERTPVVLPRERVLASAGTGKTYLISSRIIGLLAAGAPVEEIFGSTFTRKAAGEILDRVLERLAAAASDADAAAELSGAALLPGSTPATLPPAAWRTVLRRLVGDLHRVNVGTLDAFFIRAASSFAEEVGLPPGWTIADGPMLERVRSEALQEVLASGDAGAVVALLREMRGADGVRSVHAHLLSELRTLLELHHSLDPTAPDPWGALDAYLSEDAPDVDSRRGALADALAVFPRPTKKGTDEPKQNWDNALNRAADALRAGDWDGLLGETLCGRVLQGESVYDRSEIAPELARLVEEACGLARTALLRRAAARNRATGRLATLLAAAVARKQRETGAYDFSDVTRLIGGPDPLGERPDLYYRLDARTQHILLDEFQDTSLAQWEALEPLVEELLAGHAGERAAVVVADPKQSIYAWRGGEPMLVQALGDRFEMEDLELSRSWRSSQVVLDAANRVFDAIDRNPGFGDDEVARGVAASWRAAFPHHEAVKVLPGHVRLEVGPADDGQGSDRPNLCRRAAELVAELRTRAPGRTIGVLTRRNSTVARIIYELRRLDVPASEEGGNPLTDSAAVASVLALLRMAEHPGDTISRYHVARTPVGAAMDFVDHTDGRAALRVTHRLRRELASTGYGRTLAEIVGRLESACSPRERRRLEQLVELAFRYDAAPAPTLRISDFLRLVEAEQVEDPTSAAVRVMTVHKAKGLEFDAVVLPELDTELAREDTGLLSYRPSPTARPTLAFQYVKKAVRELVPEAAELHEAVKQARQGRLRDGLSALYVALTRARHALHVIVKPDGRSGPGRTCTPALLVRNALAPGAPGDEGRVLFETGDPEWYARGEAPVEGRAEAASTVAPPPGRVSLRRDGARSRGFVRRTPSELARGGTIDLSLLLNLDASAASEGTIAHAWFERIGWLEDGIPAEDELRAVARELDPGIPDPRLEALISRFHGWLGEPAVAAAMSRAAYPEGASYERELRFMHRQESTVVEGSIDRLVLIREGDRVTGAVVIDFKTDQVARGDTEALARKLAQYAPQLEAYRHAVAGAYRISADSVRCQLLVLEAAATVAL